MLVDEAAGLAEDVAEDALGLVLGRHLAEAVGCKPSGQLRRPVDRRERGSDAHLKGLYVGGLRVVDPRVGEQQERLDVPPLFGQVDDQPPFLISLLAPGGQPSGRERAGVLKHLGRVLEERAAERKVVVVRGADDDVGLGVPEGRVGGR